MPHCRLVCFVCVLKSHLFEPCLLFIGLVKDDLEGRTMQERLIPTYFVVAV